MIIGTAAAAKAQVEPEAISPGRVAVKGTLTYSARYSQIAEFYNGGTGQMANLSGNFGYSTTSQRHPTSISLGAGDSWRISGIDYSGGPYESLTVSQALNGEHWQMQLGDSVGYHNGVGVSEPNPSSPNSTAEPVQTLNTTMLDNDASARLNDKISGATSLSAGAGYNILEYPNGDGLGTTGLMVNTGFSHRFEARDTIFGQYAFSQYSYSTGLVTIDANTAIGGWERIWTRRISTSVSAGPEWLTFQTSGPVPSVSGPVPSVNGYNARASITDTSRLGSATASFTHGVTGGGGYLYGAEETSFTGSLSRQFGRKELSRWTVSVVGGYRITDALKSLQSVSLPSGFGTQGDYTSKYGSAQASRHLGRLFSVNAGYMATDQSANTAVSASVVNGVWQTLSFGIGFTPPAIHLRQ